MNENLKITVVIPCYNAASYLEKTINSLKEQTLKNVEFIFVDDGSKDNTLNVLEEKLKSVNLDYKIIKKLNGGVSSARNRGLEEASGDYVLFLDSDDFIEANMLELMADKAYKSDLDIIFCGYDYVNDKGQYYKKYDERFEYLDGIIDGTTALEYMLTNKIHIWTGSIVYKRSLLIDNKVRYYEGCNYGEDFEFICKALATAKSVSSVNQVLSHYLQRENSLANTFNINNFKSLGAMNRLKWFVKKNIKDEYLTSLCEDMFNLEMLVIYNRYIVKSKQDDVIDKIFTTSYPKFRKKLKSYKLTVKNKERIKRYVLVKMYIYTKNIYTKFMKRKHNI